MKKVLLIPALVAGLHVSAKPVDVQTAKKAGYHFLVDNMRGSQVNADEMRLAYTAHSNAAQPVNFFYVFNVNANAFVMVSVDDQVVPVFGYSTESAFDANNIPETAVDWFNNYSDQIQYVIEHNIPATGEITSKWNYLLTAPDNNTGGKTTVSGTPLVFTTWNQDPYYNDMCPLDVSSNQKTVTGCVATAMAQIMKYWNYPATGTGTYSYSQSPYGNLSANFGATTYQWGAMPNALGAPNTAVATLMYHLGVSVNMHYGTASSGGSGAYVTQASSPLTNCAEYALKTYFGYDANLHGINRAAFSDLGWINTLKIEIDNLRPVLYSGFGNAGGHAWVADAYDNNDFFHINWGWGGVSNGYYSVDAMNPPALGSGGGNGGFNNYQTAIIGIQPPASSMAPDAYEVNNITAQAYNLPVSFASGTAHITTAGSTIHSTNDVDYYSITLPAGDNYEITPRLHDSANSGNGQTYSLNAKFAVSGNGGGFWSADFDDVLSSSITFNGGGVYIFRVMPKYAGFMGSYLLDITVQRAATGVADVNTQAEVSVYPNPASGYLNIDLKGIGGKAVVNVVDMQGRQLIEHIYTGNQLVNMPLNGLSNGLYFVRIQTDKGTVTKKIAVE